MQIDVQSRGFSLSRGLQSAVESEAHEYATRAPNTIAGMLIRLFDINGPRGGSDKVCLVQARLQASRKSVVASHVDADLYRAISVAFAKLERGTRSVLGARKARCRRPLPGCTRGQRLSSRV